MSAISETYGKEYLGALQDYLAGAGEAALQQAYQLGRRAMSDGLGVLDVAVVHHQALLTFLEHTPNAAEREQPVLAAGGFLAESLSPFEFTHRGYQEASVLLRQTLEFAAAVCHELRTPLTSIQASAGMLQEVLRPDPMDNVARLLTNILGGVSALNSRMNDLVDMSGFLAGGFSIQMEEVDTRRLLNQVIQRLEPVVRRSGLNLQGSIPGELPVIRADPRRLEQITSNLIQNAIKFGFEGGRIDLRARTLDDHILVEVQDYGKGISQNDQAKLFQPFVRLGLDRQRVPGLGIGLALCKQLVEAHDGRIWVVSEVGSGATFKFELPVRSPIEPSEESL